MIAFTQHIRVLPEFPQDYAGEFLVRFGNVTIPDTVSSRKMHDLPLPSPESVAEIVATPLDMVNGLLFLVDDISHGLDMDAVKAVQKEYLFRYYKEIVLPNSSPLAPAAEGVRQQAAPEIVRILNKLLNIPYALRYPLTQKLAPQKIRQPVLLLLPGPSLSELGPRLRELARGNVVVAVSRTLKFCLEQGVEPDFVVQLDTYLIQRDFFQKIPALPHTTLVALSISPVYGLLGKFKGILFMDSFDLTYLKNPYRLRENGLSTLMACMGLAECLSAPYAALAGADLSFPGGTAACQYHDGDLATADPDAPAYIQVNGPYLFMRNRASRGVFTTLNYLAVAREAERYARDIALTTGTRFCVIGESGILSSRHFPDIDLDTLMESPELDREKLEIKVNEALAQSEDVDLIRLKVDCIKTKKQLDQNVLFLDACRVNNTREGLERNPIYLFAHQERDFNLPDDPEIRLAFALKIAQKWRGAVTQAHNVVVGHMIARREGEIPLVCLPEEAGRPLPDLEKLFPGFSWGLRPLVGPAEPKGTGSPYDVCWAALHRELAALQVAFVTTAAREAYRDFFDVYGPENLFHLEPFATE